MATTTPAATPRPRVAEVADYLPFEITGLFYVEGEISGDGGECAGNGYVKLVGSPIGTVPWIAALGLIVVGLGLGFFAFPKAAAASGLAAMSLPPDDLPSAPAPPPPPPPPSSAPSRPACSSRDHHPRRPTAPSRDPRPPPDRGFFAGVLVGLGVVIMLVIYAKAAYTTPWPLLGIVGVSRSSECWWGCSARHRKRAAGPTDPAVAPASGGSDGSSSPGTATA